MIQSDTKEKDPIDDCGDKEAVLADTPITEAQTEDMVKVGPWQGR